MKANKLIPVLLLSMLMGLSFQALAIPVSMDAEGTVTSYRYYGDSDPFSGSIGAGDSFVSSSILDPETAVDSDASSSVGRYNWSGGIFATTATVSMFDFNFALTNVVIINDDSAGRDLYRINTATRISSEERLFLSLILTDQSGSVFSDDSFVLEPAFDMFSSARFSLRSINNDGSMNYRVLGDLSSLVDPCIPGISCDESASVPEPNTIFLLGLGLIAVFFASSRGRKETPLAA